MSVIANVCNTPWIDNTTFCGIKLTYDYFGSDGISLCRQARDMMNFAFASNSRTVFIDFYFRNLCAVICLQSLYSCFSSGSSQKRQEFCSHLCSWRWSVVLTQGHHIVTSLLLLFLLLNRNVCHASCVYLSRRFLYITQILFILKKSIRLHWFFVFCTTILLHYKVYYITRFIVTLRGLYTVWVPPMSLCG